MIRQAIEDDDATICDILRDVFKSDTTNIVESLDDNSAEKLMNLVQNVRFFFVLPVCFSINHS